MAPFAITTDIQLTELQPGVGARQLMYSRMHPTHHYLHARACMPSDNSTVSCLSSGKANALILLNSGSLIMLDGTQEL